MLTVGLINNMPDAALQATERQFIHLLTAAAGNNCIQLHCFSLPSVKRSQSAKWRVDQQYTDIADIDRWQINGLIVTGAEPNAATLPEETFWRDLTEVVDWAKTNTRSIIWSCLAAHAPPSPAQTGRAVFPHPAFMNGPSRPEAKVSVRPALPS